MTDIDGPAGDVLTGHVKWFDPGKGFGFIVADAGGPDILLHANVLRNFGQSSVADGAPIGVVVQRTDRGLRKPGYGRLRVARRRVRRARRVLAYP